MDGVATFAQDTIVKVVDGAGFKLEQFGLSDLDPSIISISNINQAITFGIVGQHLVFSKPVRLSLPTPDLSDSTQVSIQVKHE